MRKRKTRMGKLAPKNDKEKLKLLGIESPDLDKMRYRVHLPEKNITYYFKNKARYLKFKEEHGL